MQFWDFLKNNRKFRRNKWISWRNWNIFEEIYGLFKEKMESLEKKRDFSQKWPFMGKGVVLERKLLFRLLKKLEFWRNVKIFWKKIETFKVA